MAAPDEKPQDIAQDAWDAAVSVIEDIPGRGPYGVVAAEDVARAIMAAKAEEREAIVQLCEAEKVGFLSPEYASNQPLGSLLERFAIDECIRAIRKRGEG